MTDQGTRDELQEILARIKPASDAEVAAWETRQAQLRRASALRTAEVPARLMAELESGNIDPERAPGPQLREHLDAGRRMVLMLGRPGTGKTIAAVLAIRDRPGPRFMRADWYVAHLQSYTTAWDAEKAALKTSLVIDELGEEPDHKRGEMDNLLSARYDQATVCTTIVTSNLLQQEFADRYGPRIVSRFKDPRYCAVILCRDSLRPQRGQKR